MCVCVCVCVYVCWSVYNQRGLFQYEVSLTTKTGAGQKI